jgi:hypothetical protein
MECAAQDYRFLRGRVSLDWLYGVESAEKETQEKANQTEPKEGGESDRQEYLRATGEVARGRTGERHSRV